jgi:carboxypeptidase C (cathepsin A)
MSLLAPDSPRIGVASRADTTSASPTTRLALAVLFAAGPGGDRPLPAAPASPQVSERRVGAESRVERRDDDTIVTRHQIALPGRTLRYTARAGHIPLRENTSGELRGQMFFVAYTVERAPGQPARPLTFAWNGGPGAASSLLHLGALGPRRTRLEGEPAGESGADGVIDNEATWLDETDLVFVDPIGTGFSRPARPEFGKMFWNIQGDVDSVAEFIRVYRDRYDPSLSAVFIAGESYGTVRAAGVAEALVSRGVPLAGVLLISGAFTSQLTGDVRHALMVPSYAAAAFFHNKLPADMQGNLEDTLRQAESWAETEFAAALMKGDRLEGEQRQAVLAKLARFTGLDTAFLDRNDLRVDMVAFARQLLRDRQLVIGHYDSRLTVKREAPEGQYDPTTDPSLKSMGTITAPIRRYLADELGFRNDLLYAGPFGGGWPPATTPRGDWMSVLWDFGGGMDRSASLKRALERDRTMRIFVASGIYDLATPYYATEYALSHLGLAKDTRANIRIVRYPGGHSMYLEAEDRLRFAQDATRFIRDALAARTGKGANP